MSGLVSVLILLGLGGLFPNAGANEVPSYLGRYSPVAVYSANGTSSTIGICAAQLSLEDANGDPALTWAAQVVYLVDQNGRVRFENAVGKIIHQKAGWGFVHPSGEFPASGTPKDHFGFDGIGEVYAEAFEAGSRRYGSFTRLDGEESWNG